MFRVKGQWAICIHTRLATSPLRSGFDCESLIKHARNAWVPLCSSYFDPPFLSAFFVLSAMMRLICTVASAAWLKLLCRSSGQHFHSIFQGCLKWGMPWNRRSIDIYILLLWDMMKPGIWGVHNFRDNTQLQPFCSALLVILVYDDSVDDVGLCRIPMLVPGCWCLNPESIINLFIFPMIFQFSSQTNPKLMLPILSLIIAPRWITTNAENP